jgi:hypothetical protein
MEGGFGYMLAAAGQLRTTRHGAQTAAGQNDSERPEGRPARWAPGRSVRAPTPGRGAAIHALTSSTPSLLRGKNLKMPSNLTVRVVISRALEPIRHCKATAPKSASCVPSAEITLALTALLTPCARSRYVRNIVASCENPLHRYRRALCAGTR